MAQARQIVQTPNRQTAPQQQRITVTSSMARLTVTREGCTTHRLSSLQVCHPGPSCVLHHRGTASTQPHTRYGFVARPSPGSERDGGSLNPIHRYTLFPHAHCFSLSHLGFPQVGTTNWFVSPNGFFWSLSFGTRRWRFQYRVLHLGQTAGGEGLLGCQECLQRVQDSLGNSMSCIPIGNYLEELLV